MISKMQQHLGHQLRLLGDPPPALPAILVHRQPWPCIEMHTLQASSTHTALTMHFPVFRFLECKLLRNSPHVLKNLFSGKALCRFIRCSSLFMFETVETTRTTRIVSPKKIEWVNLTTTAASISSSSFPKLGGLKNALAKSVRGKEVTTYDLGE